MKKRPYDTKTNSGKEKVSLWEKNSRTLKRMIFLKEKRGESIITYKPWETSSPGRRVTIKTLKKLSRFRKLKGIQRLTKALPLVVLTSRMLLETCARNVHSGAPIWSHHTCWGGLSSDTSIGLWVTLHPSSCELLFTHVPLSYPTSMLLGATPHPCLINPLVHQAGFGWNLYLLCHCPIWGYGVFFVSS